MPLDEENDRQRKISIALKKIKSYSSAGRLNEILVLTKGKISENTIRAWIADNKKAFSAYKSNTLIEISDKIEPIGNKKWIAYEIAVSELCVSIKDQDRLDSYSGLYEVFHDLPENYTIDFTKISFGLKDNYRFFWTKYKSSEDRRFCDGFTFIRGSKIVLAGTSRQVTLFASLRFSDDERYSLFGTVMIDDHKLQKTFSSKIALHRNDIPKNTQLHDRLLMYSMRSGYEV